MFVRAAMTTIGLLFVSTMAFAQTPETGAADTAARHHRSVNARQHHQRAAIRQGVTSGEINRRELDRLAADEAAIRAEERVYRRTGDGLNRREYVDLQRDLNRTHREIRRALRSGSGE